jgi:hypothetical protein
MCSKNSRGASILKIPILLSIQKVFLTEKKQPKLANFICCVPEILRSVVSIKLDAICVILNEPERLIRAAPQSLATP